MGVEFASAFLAVAIVADFVVEAVADDVFGSCDATGCFVAIWVVVCVGKTVLGRGFRGVVFLAVTL